MADGRKLQSMEAAARAAAPSYDRVAELQKYLGIFERIRAR
jgi:hypothetical protein